jgi:hypothetical protein
LRLPDFTCIDRLNLFNLEFKVAAQYKCLDGVEALPAQADRIDPVIDGRFLKAIEDEDAS